MILRVTAKLGKKIKSIPTETLPLDADPFADWSAHLFTAERRQYILLANTTSLYTVVMPGRGITSVDTFVRGMQLALQKFLPIDGHDDTFRKLIEPALETVAVSKALNRSITGSINDQVFGAKVFMIEGRLSLVEASNLLNETPLSILDHSPRDTFRSLVDQAVDPMDRGDEEGTAVQPGSMPRNPKKWIEEIRKAYADARDSIPFCRLVDPTFGERELFHLAASIAVKFRGLRSDEKKLEQATEAALSTYVANIAEQKETLTDPRLAFALCYLASHYGLELVGTATIEDVMALAVQHRELIAPSGEEPGLQFGMKR